MIHMIQTNFQPHIAYRAVHPSRAVRVSLTRLKV